MSDIKIVPMGKCHVEKIAELEKLCFSSPWSANSIASELENPLSLWLVATDGTQLLGYIGSQSVLNEADMMNVAVDPDARRRGVGRLLVTSLVDDLKNRGIRSLTLEVRASNEGAKAMYQKLGFLEVGRRPKYYFDPREDALILRKEWEL